MEHARAARAETGLLPNLFDEAVVYDDADAGVDLFAWQKHDNRRVVDVDDRLPLDGFCFVLAGFGAGRAVRPEKDRGLSSSNNDGRKPGLVRRFTC
jgi:hypothetical protein